jgi:hypothetical protein
VASHAAWMKILYKDMLEYEPWKNIYRGDFQRDFHFLQPSFMKENVTLTITDLRNRNLQASLIHLWRAD